MAYEDLLKDTSQSFEDGNYFIVTVPDLTPGTIYPLEFRWKYKDGTFADWGCVKTITAAPETSPKKPTLTATYFQGIITVAWNGKAFDAASYSVVDRVEVYLQNINIGTYFPAGSIQYNNGVGGTLSIPVEPGTYKVKGRAVSKGSLESVYSDEITITAKLEPPVDVTTVSASWAATDFNITFTHDPAAATNKWLSYYLVTLTSGLDTKTFNLLPITGTTQKFSMSLASNRAAFGVPKTSFSGSVRTVDIYGNTGTAVTFGNIAYVNSLTPPTITATEIQQGYSIAYTTPTSSSYDHIEIEEVESSASSAPSSGYSVIFSGVANPAPIIRPNQNKRWVRARFADNIGSFSAYSTAIAATPLSPITADTTPPAAPATGSVTAGVDNSTGATVGFNAYLNISWNAVSDTSLRGYRIRFRENGTTNPYSYVDSPGTGTSFRLNGLAIGTVYEVGVASYDEYNNTSSAYTSLGTAQATGTPFIGKNVTTQGYFGASATGDTGTFKFGYGVQDSGGVKRGLVFNSSNYWYIDSAQSALFKLGGDTNNYIEWNGTSFIVQGDIRARAGNFSGNVQIASGGSLYSGTIVSNNLSGAGFILNNSGLTFNSSTVNGITTINGTTGLFTTSSANIGGWSVTSGAISKTSSSGTITLNSSNAQITLGSTSYSAGIATPDTNSAADIVFWAGGSRNTSANFYVRADGTVKLASAIITGYATQASLDSTNTTVSGKVSASQVKDNLGGTGITTITGDKVSTGTISGNSYSYDGTLNPFSNNGMAIDLTNNIIRSPQFAIVGGNAYFKGQLSAASGSFSGSVTSTSFSLTAGSDFWNSNGSFQFGGSTGITKSTTGAISIGSNVVISGSLTANQVSTTNLTIDTSGRIYNSGGFEVTAAGKLIATGAEFTGSVKSGSTITGAAISGGSINITGYPFGSATNDSEGTAGDITSESNAFASTYVRNSITTVGFNAIAFTSVTSAGVVSSWYPYYDASVDLGVKSSTANGTNPFRWRNLRLTGIAYFGGNGFSDTLSTSTPTASQVKIAINSSGTIYANLLGVSTGSTIVQNADGFLKVSSSSRRYKENIVPISGTYLDAIKQLTPVTFNYKEEFSGTPNNPEVAGLIAEDVAEIEKLDKIVNYNNEGTPESISYDRLSVFLAMSIKELSEKIDNISNRLDALEG